MSRRRRSIEGSSLLLPGSLTLASCRPSTSIELGPRTSPRVETSTWRHGEFTGKSARADAKDTCARVGLGTAGAAAADHDASNTGLAPVRPRRRDVTLTCRPRESGTSSRRYGRSPRSVWFIALSFAFRSRAGTRAARALRIRTREPALRGRRPRPTNYRAYSTPGWALDSKRTSEPESAGCQFTPTPALRPAEAPLRSAARYSEAVPVDPRASVTKSIIRVLSPRPSRSRNISRGSGDRPVPVCDRRSRAPG